jgi:hypothetical protein
VLRRLELVVGQIRPAFHISRVLVLREVLRPGRTTVAALALAAEELLLDELERELAAFIR